MPNLRAMRLSLTLRRGSLAILSGFRRLLEAIQAVGDGLQALVLAIQEVGPGAVRLDALELSRHQFEAECSGALLEAKGKLKGALSSEARERHMIKQSEKDADPLADLGEEIAEGGNPVQPNHAPAGEAERVPALRLDVAAGGKTSALMHKWSR